MNEVFLVEDHDAVLKIWKKQNIKSLDLIHLDAHIDFGFFMAKSPEKLLNEAKSVKDFKRRLEYTLNFLHYERDFNKQINIGNYIYPAIEEGIVNNFYWVIPGKSKEFKASAKTIKRILKQIIRYAGNKDIIQEDRNGIIYTQCLGRKLVVCNLDNLPVKTEEALLDIDVDFLVIDSVLNAENTKNVGKRKPWILPPELLNLLKEKIKAPRITTISYSVNGGWTPIRYKHLGDDLAFQLAPLKFKTRFEIKQRAAGYFKLFETMGKREYYRRAIKLDSTYRCMDNNYGPLYLALKKFSLAQREFKKILKADPTNPSAILGLGSIALQRRNFKGAKRYFYAAKRFSKDGLFKSTKTELLFNLAKTEFHLRDFNPAKKFLLRYKSINPLEPQSYYLLGYIFEKEKEFTQAALFYKDAMRLGFGSIEPIYRLLKVSGNLKQKDDLLKFISSRYRQFKKGFIRLKRLKLKKGKKIRGLQAIDRRMQIIEAKLKGGIN